MTLCIYQLILIDWDMKGYLIVLAEQSKFQQSKNIELTSICFYINININKPINLNLTISNIVNNYLDF